MASETYPSGRVGSHTYTRLGQASTLTSGGSTLVSSVSYYGHGGINALVMGNGLTEQNCYNTRLQPTIRRLGTGTQSGCANGGDKLHLTFDWGAAGSNNGNLKGQTIAAPGFSQTQYYEYDATNRLKIAVEGAPVPGSLTCPATSSWCREYNYDHFGNRWVSSNRTMHMAVPTSQSAFNAANNRLTAGGYDAAGNMTSHPWITPGGSMAYNANNLMTSFTATGVSVQTAYDAAGRRVRKINGTEVTLWVYDAAGRLAAEYRNGSGPGFAASTPDREYSYSSRQSDPDGSHVNAPSLMQAISPRPEQSTHSSSRLVAIHDPSGTYYRTADHLGSTRIVTDSAGSVKQRVDYFPFGESIPADTSHGNRQLVVDQGVATYNSTLPFPVQFTEKQYDAATALYYFDARNLSASAGRFLSVDPANAGMDYSVSQSWHGYSYVFNHPLVLLDPNGKDPCRTEKGREIGDPCFSAEGRAYRYSDVVIAVYVMLRATADMVNIDQPIFFSIAAPLPGLPGQRSGVPGLMFDYTIIIDNDQACLGIGPAAGTPGVNAGVVLGRIDAEGNFEFVSGNIDLNEAFGGSGQSPVFIPPRVNVGAQVFVGTNGQGEDQILLGPTIGSPGGNWAVGETACWDLP